ncbi:hypothetical protein JOF56_009249 [Kibdelosporangium banguiense]|uniref:DUF4157 domain-containing protein n=1 Tax=Kibdelosporangium banguiense TaxID=1365924 RepID=A0ABS4TWV5_9PSEU|nr:DUF4157 domain-containing protein [Kibdelosporangium banguiense]MBP2328864.1 hypothetical protein [Kibdelosporangium banguiense]
MLREPGSPLRPQLRADMESRLDADLSTVRLHAGALAHAAAQAVQAQAFTAGEHIVFQRSAYAPATAAGRRTLAHELTHVLQQRSGTVGGTDSGTGLRVSDPGDAFELAAEANVDRVMSGLSPTVRGEAKALAHNEGAIQRVTTDDENGGSDPAGIEAKARLKASITKKRRNGPEGDAKTPEKSSASTIKKILEKRLKVGPLFSDDDLDDIEVLSASPTYPKWLTDAGIDTSEAAREYLNKKDYLQWHPLPAGKKILIATLQWKGVRRQDANLTPTDPAYILGRHLALKGGTLGEDERKEVERERDEQIRDMFVRTIDASLTEPAATVKKSDWEKNKRATDILTRVFHILRHGLQVWREQGDGAPGHVDYKEGDVARALAHGGRVTIRIPSLTAEQTGHELTDWLGLTSDGKGREDEKRGFATHRVDIGDGRFEEKGGMFASLINVVKRDAEIYGLNLAAGGLGQLDFNGAVILPDGSHGHMLMVYQKPTATKEGSLMVGIETVGPGAKSPVGYVHNWRSSEKTANPVSSMLGHKEDKIAGGKLKNNRMLVELGRFPGGWENFLTGIAEKWDSDLKAAKDNEQKRRELLRKLVGPRE